MKKIFDHQLFRSAKNFISSRPKISALLLIVLIVSGYYGYRQWFGASTDTRYVLATVERGTIVSSVEGTGQVSASSQIDIKSRASGDIVYVAKVTGETVPAGTLLAQVDTRTAVLELESARIAYAKLVQPADTVSTLQAKNSIADALDSRSKAYSDGFVSVTNTFVDYTTVLTGLDDMLNSYQSGKGFLNESNARAYGDTGTNYRNKAASSYYLAKNKYEAATITFKGLNRDSATSSISDLINQTYDATQALAMAIKDAKTTVDFIRASQNSSNLPSLLASSQTDLATWGSQINSDLQSLLAVKNTIDSSARQIRDKTETLAKLEAGADALDVRSQALALQQKEIAYQDYFIRAPFEGVLAKLSIGKNETVSGGTSIGVFIAKQKVADISLNEVDVAKVKIGQPVTLTFDAVDGLTLTGKVVEVDLVGTVSSGVVNYNVKIAFDVDDARVRSGMSVSASIITDTRPDVLIVPSSAVKSQGNTSYVEVLMGDFASSTGSVGVTSATAPEQRVVEVGVSNDSDVEIVSGLKEGEQVVTKTTTGTTATTKTTKTQSATSLLRSAGGGPGGR